MDVMMVYLRGITAKLRSEDGATAVEYGIMVALIAVVIIGAVTAIGLALNGKFGEVNGALGGG